ncbi:MAG: T9SS type A sorting domain-containing protein [Ignavibacteriales bacterium]|nr:MAG: T9SS type A sorting domain-containing protein [Ignavibacteriales bacterium]
MKKILFLIVLLYLPGMNAQTVQRARVLAYNLLAYPESYETRNPYYSLIINNLEPDIVVINEVTSSFGQQKFLDDVLGSDFTAAPYTDGYDSDNQLYYKDSLFTLLGFLVINTSLRQIDHYILQHNFTGDTLRVFAAHLKAGQGTAEEQQRLSEVTALRNRTDALPSGSNFIFVGDFNLYTSGEAAYQKLLDQTSPGYLLDPLNRPGNWNNNSSFADIHTQSTRLSQVINNGSTGGLDDRFDFILISQSVKDSGGVYYLPGTFRAYGNDGLHFNKSVNVEPFTLVSQQTADALYYASDHLPVFADFEFQSTPTSVDENLLTLREFILEQNYPNPFNPETKIKFTVPYINPNREFSHQTSLKVFDVLGNEIITLVNEHKLPGVYEVDFYGENLSSGIYFYRLQSGDFIDTKKMVLIK